MPKTGLEKKEWQNRLKMYANGKFAFQRGQRPPANSAWAREISMIETCPRHKSVTGIDLFKKPILCVCGYHSAKIQVCS